VTRFWEKPSEVQAKVCLEIRCFWNTFVLVAKLSTLLDVGRRILPDLSERMVRAARYVAAGNIGAAEREYGNAAKADFSQTILQGCPEALAVSPLPSVTWSDLGTPHNGRADTSKDGADGARTPQPFKTTWWKPRETFGRMKAGLRQVGSSAGRCQL
jgi:mannose-1-phosphate guanylyltransferase